MEPRITYNKVKLWHEHLSNISEKATIGEGTVLHAAAHVHDDVVIGKDCQIEAQVFIPNGVTLEDNVFVGPMVCFTNDLTLDTPRNEWEPVKTLVKKGVRIGANATIRAGVTIGENAIIGCGSVVLKDIPPGEKWAGNPAKPL